METNEPTKVILNPQKMPTITELGIFLDEINAGDMQTGSARIVIEGLPDYVVKLGRLEINGVNFVRIGPASQHPPRMNP